MYKKFLKRLFDVSISFLLIIILLPLFIIISFLVLMIDGWPIFFIQKRPGFECKIFKIIKFRTMSISNSKSDIDRISKLGNFLRLSSLDELPELFNVLKGEMSFVGPRPLLIEYLEHYSKKQIKRHNCKPGITGLAQIHGRNKIEWDQKFEYDLNYLENITFINDLKIILKTLIIIFQIKKVNRNSKYTMEKFSDKL